MTPITHQRAIAMAMLERELQDRVRLMCDHLGLAVQHIEDARRCWLPGWPDLTVLGTSVMFIELKNMTNTLSADQRKVRRIIEGAGLAYRLWRPADLLDGTVAQELTAISKLSITAFTAADIERIAG
jgi:hypothetical protein